MDGYLIQTNQILGHPFFRIYFFARALFKSFEALCTSVWAFQYVSVPGPDLLLKIAALAHRAKLSVLAFNHCEENLLSGSGILWRHAVDSGFPRKEFGYINN